MADPTSTIVGIKEAFAGAIAFLLGLIQWTFRRQLKRVDELQETVEDLDKEAIRRTEFNETTSSLRTEVRDGNDGTHRRLDALMQSMTDKR